MGAGWKNPIAAANAARRGKIISKLAKEIAVAAKMGGADPEANPRLRMAIHAAKEESCPRETIERAIRNGAGLDKSASDIEEISYEGFGPHNVGVIVECQTDNRHRTAPEIRNVFKSNGGHMGEVGSVAWMFERVALVDAAKNNVKDPEEDAIEVGANEVLSHGNNSYSFYGAVGDLDAIRVGLIERGWDVKTSELSYKVKNPTELNDEQKKDVRDLLQALDDNDDTYRIYTTAVDC